MMWLANKIIAWAEKREPEEIIGDGKGHQYMRRHHVVRIYGVLNIYVHQFMCSDDERGKHDHPWWSISWMLRGSMLELYDEDKERFIWPGDIIVRSAKLKHRLLVASYYRGKVWTLFITGPKTQEWGFYLADGWVHWTKLSKRELANEYAENERA